MAKKKDLGGFNLHTFYERFPDEKACRDYLVKARFPDGNIACVKCGSMDKIYTLKDGKRYKCNSCKHIFTITVGTIFEASHVSLHKWFLAIYIISAHKKGISSLQLHRDIGVTQKTAWFMLHRIRYMLNKSLDGLFLSGVVEADEAYVKGGDRSLKSKHGLNRSLTPVLGIVQRGGKVMTMPVKKASQIAIQSFVKNNITPNAVLITDEHVAYKPLGYDFSHYSVNHSMKQYVDGVVHTNTIEGYWGLLKRGIVGIYHRVSPKHLHRYCDEYQYRYNTRTVRDNERFEDAMQNTERRMTYAQLISDTK